MDLNFIGTFLINGALIFLLSAVLTVVGVHYQILQEEKLLSSAYGQEYQAYCHKTNRYFGWQRTRKENEGA
jgi:protein-S-isoprenylcysteine O-methyltransferase Ste14